MTALESITLAIAIFGLVLGLINTWHALDRTRVKLRVRPNHVIPVGAMDPQLTFCIEVVNLSSFAVTIEEAGVFYKGTNSRAAYSNPVLLDSGAWPRRLESRESVTIYGQPPKPHQGHTLKCAYARTACGVVRKGSSPAFRQLVSGNTT